MRHRIHRGTHGQCLAHASRLPASYHDVTPPAAAAAAAGAATGFDGGTHPTGGFHSTRAGVFGQGPLQTREKAGNNDVYV